MSRLGCGGAAAEFCDDIEQMAGCDLGFYEISIDINNYPFLEHKEVKSYDVFQVRVP